MKNETETVLRISEGRKLIALFMGKVTHHPQNIDGWKEQILLEAPGENKKIHYPFGCLPPFDTKWEWLMPVVDKIEEDELNEIMIMPRRIYVNRGENFQSQYQKGYDFKRGNKLKTLYNAVVDFIKWHNETQARGANS